MGDLEAMRVNTAAFGDESQDDPSSGESLRARGTRLLTLALDASDDGIWAWHLPTGEAFFSPRYYTMLGYEPDEFPAGYDTWAGLLHPDDLEKTQAVIQQHINERSEGYEVEFRLRTKDGDWLWILGRGRVAEWDDEGEPLRLVGSHINIDSRKRVEQELAEYRTQLEEMVRERTLELEQTTSLFEATFNAIPDVLGIQDDKHNIIRYNAAGYRFLEMRREDIEGKRCFELIGRNNECDQCATSMCYRTKMPASCERYEEALDAWLDVRAYPILDDDGNLVKVIEHLRDITPEKKAAEENRRLQEQLLDVQKMDSLGTLAGGIAHDFNNLLMGIQGRISLMSNDSEGADANTEHIKAIEEYIASATNLTKQLLGFARGGKYEIQPIDINRLMLESASMFGRTRKDLQIHTKVDDLPVTVEADKRQIEQVLLNIFINAWQAMPGGGELYLETSVDVLDDAVCRSHRVEPGRYAKIQVTDNGIGMDGATRKRIFDPFFTTKDKGRGTGLGLASAYGIIKNHSGFITVYSEVGRGSTFNVYLPVSDQDAVQEVLAEKTLVEGSETVLLVDDEEIIIDVCTAMLERLGYQVMAANNGEQAIEIVRERHEEIDLVILDLIMPKMDGEKTFELIREINKEIPMILSSGYALNGQATHIMKKGCNGFIQKPFDFSALSQKIREILDEE